MERTRTSATASRPWYVPLQHQAHTKQTRTHAAGTAANPPQKLAPDAAPGNGHFETEKKKIALLARHSSYAYVRVDFNSPKIVKKHMYGNIFHEHTYIRMHLIFLVVESILYHGEFYRANLSDVVARLSNSWFVLRPASTCSSPPNVSATGPPTAVQQQQQQQPPPSSRSRSARRALGDRPRTRSNRCKKHSRTCARQTDRQTGAPTPAHRRKTAALSFGSWSHIV